MSSSGIRNHSTSLKRLMPGAPGTKGLVERFGSALLCVRYRYDPIHNRRLTTVELIVEDRPAKPEKTAWIRVAYGETELRQRIKEAGGIWHAERKLWMLGIRKIKVLKLESRIVANV
ncbi:MAG: hypothetical protein F9K30_07205 [Dechloromonas sp.]|nr:MAG: hypothetical protein F9K30_07205 [Dechloromonas sp.]